MLKNTDIICISSIDWDFVWQGHQEIMSTFAKNGNRVLFIENTGVRTPGFKDLPRLKKRIVNWYKSIKGFKKQADNLYIYSPVILPFPYSKLARWINRRMLIRPLKNWMRVMEFHEPVVWTFLPTGTALDIINSIDNKKLLVYYCIANFYELAGSKREVKITEERLIKQSDVVFAQGSEFYDKCRRLNSNVSIFPFGVNMDVFEKKGNSAIPDDMKGLSGPIVGYVGGIHRHIDFDILRFVAQERPGWSIVLVGPKQIAHDEFRGLKNIHMLGKKDFIDLPGYIRQFDVCVIPYKKTEYTATVYPTKLNEYHALGKPVVSVDLAEVVNFNRENGNLVYVAKSPRDFLSAIDTAISKDSQQLVKKRIDSARQNSWPARIEKMSLIIEKSAIDKLRSCGDWQQRFVKLYRAARRKAMGWLFGLLAAYLLVFYTPLVWFLASPLKLSQEPKKSDCIVVFAGGVGESGKAGQGYEERVKYAVELYRKGYARNLVFSSGYAYAFKEPLVMKALALSLGVPEQDIFLEEEAANTYQNVVLTSRILESRNWASAIFVSSPYNMRRVALTVKKNASGIKAIYAPIPQSNFYGRSRKFGQQISFSQIKALLHEYMAICYYYLKGWI